MTTFNIRYTPNGINVYNYLKKICDILGTTELTMRLYGELKAALKFLNDNKKRFSSGLIDD